MLKNFEKSLLGLKNLSVEISDAGAYPEPGTASVQLLFADGSKLRADYWRLIKDGNTCISSFDHQQQYGLPAPLDAIKQLQKQLQSKTLTEARLDRETGDLLLEFNQGMKFQVLNFTGYEVWEIRFPNGTGEYSNYARQRAPGCLEPLPD